MTDLRTAAQQALWALELDAYGEPARAERDAAIDDLRAALAEPEHTPDCALLKIPSNDCDCAALVEPEAELVAWGVMKRGERVWYVNDSKLVCDDYASLYAHRDANGPDQSVVPLYTAPHRREWVGLTDDEKRLFSSWLDEKPDAEVFAGIEAVLKEKNT